MKQVAESVDKVFSETFEEVNSTLKPLESYYQKKPKRFGANITDVTLIGEALRHEEHQRRLKKTLEARDKKAELPRNKDGKIMSETSAQIEGIKLHYGIKLDMEEIFKKRR